MKIVAEIGINHNGDIKLAEQMMCSAKAAGCDFVKFQKRTINKVYTKPELDRPRESPFGTTNRHQKNGLEFDLDEYKHIDSRSKQLRLPWFASPWDVDSVDYLMLFSPPYIKVASASVTDYELLRKIKSTGVPVVISTGMSDRKEFYRAWEILEEQIEFILACTSTYPARTDEQNLGFIKTLKSQFPDHKIGFSNHSAGLTFCIAAAALGAEMIEFHYTLDRAMYGSDQAASIETGGMFSLVKNCRNAQAALGDGAWTVFEREQKIKDKLRK